MTDFICNDILELIGKEVDYIRIKEEKENKEMHKKKFNLVIRDLFGIALVSVGCGEMLEYSNCMQRKC